jgi:hypothetical protein
LFDRPKPTAGCSASGEGEEGEEEEEEEEEITFYLHCYILSMFEPSRGRPQGLSMY